MVMSNRFLVTGGKFLNITNKSLNPCKINKKT